MYLPHTTKYTIQKQNVHISFLNDILWGMAQLRSKIFHRFATVTHVISYNNGTNNNPT